MTGTPPGGPASRADEVCWQHTAGAAGPRRALEAIEHAIRGLLGRSIGPDENFFDAGLTSPTLVQLHQVGVRELATLPVTAMFAHPNLRALRRFLSGAVIAAPAPGDRPVEAGTVRRIGRARRELRRQTRSESGRWAQHE